MKSSKADDSRDLGNPGDKTCFGDFCFTATLASADLHSPALVSPVCNGSCADGKNRNIKMKTNACFKQKIMLTK